MSDPLALMLFQASRGSFPCLSRSKFAHAMDCSSWTCSLVYLVVLYQQLLSLDQVTDVLCCLFDAFLPNKFEADL